MARYVGGSRAQAAFHKDHTPALILSVYRPCGAASPWVCHGTIRHDGISNEGWGGGRSYSKYYDSTSHRIHYHRCLSLGRNCFLLRVFFSARGLKRQPCSLVSYSTFSKTRHDRTCDWPRVSRSDWRPAARAVGSRPLLIAGRIPAV